MTDAPTNGSATKQPTVPPTEQSTNAAGTSQVIADELLASLQGLTDISEAHQQILEAHVQRQAQARVQGNGSPTDPATGRRASGETASKASGVPSPTAFRWADLSAAAASRAMERLRDWVTWLSNRYQLAEDLPACWERHPPLIEELSALYLAWCAAYHDAAAPPSLPLRWHEGLARAIPRWRVWDKQKCRLNGHPTQPDHEDGD